MANFNAGSINVFLRAIPQGITGANRQMTTLGRTLGNVRGAALGLSTIGSAAILGSSIQEFATFEDGVNRAMSLWQTTNRGIRRELIDTAQTIAQTTRIAETDVSNAFAFFASAGFGASQTLKAVGVTADFARAGLTSMDDSINTLADSSNAFASGAMDANTQLQMMTTIADKAAKGNTLFNATALQIGKSLQNGAAAGARIANQDLETTIALIGGFAAAGIKGQVGGKAVEITMREIQRRASENSIELQAMGLAFTDANGDMLNMIDIIGKLEDKMAGMSDVQKRSFLRSAGFMERFISPLLKILGKSDQMRQFAAALNGADVPGFAGRVAGLREGAFAGSLDRLGNKLRVMQSQVIEPLVPDIERVALQIGEWAKKIGELDPAMRRWIVLGIGVLPVVLLIGSAVTQVGVMLLTFGGILSGLIAIVGGGPVALAALATAALAAGYAFAKWPEESKAAIAAVLNRLAPVTNKLVTIASNAGQDAALAFRAAWQQGIDKSLSQIQFSVNFAKDMRRKIRNLSNFVVGELQNMYSQAKVWLVDKWNELIPSFDKVTGAFLGAWRFMADELVHNSIIPDMVTASIAWLQKLFDKAGETPNAIRRSTEGADRAVERYKSTMERLESGTQKSFQMMGRELIRGEQAWKNFGQSILDTILNTISDPIFESLGDFVATLFGNFFQNFINTTGTTSTGTTTAPANNVGKQQAPIITINNTNGSDVTAEQKLNPDGFAEIEIMIKRTIASDIATGGIAGRTVGQTFGIQRSVGRR